MKTKLRPCKTCMHNTIQVKAKARRTNDIDDVNLWYCPVCGCYWLDREEVVKTTTQVIAYKSHSGEVLFHEPIC